jgi:mono/diheme cytochrome c family protein
MASLTRLTASALVGAVMALAALSALDGAERAPSVVVGEGLYMTNCASCHGKSAKGDGSLAEILRYRPSDLTVMARHNRGKFDRDKVYRIIDGRKPVIGHGDTDMPVWGDAFKCPEQGYSEKGARQCIEAVVDYLKSIQVK